MSLSYVLKEVLVMDYLSDLSKHKKLISSGYLEIEIESYIKNCDHPSDDNIHGYFCVEKCDGIESYTVSMSKGIQLKSFIIEKDEKTNLAVLKIVFNDKNQTEVFIHSSKESPREDYIFQVLQELCLNTEKVEDV